MSPSRPAGPRNPAPGRPAAPRRTAPPSAPTPAAKPVPRGKPVTAPTPTVPQEDPAPFSRAVTTYSAGGARRYSGPVTPPVVSTSSVERFAERSRARRNLARRQILLVTGSTVLVGALGWLLFFSPVLALDPAQVHIEGAGTVVAVDQVLDVVGAHATTPLPRLDTVRLRDEVLEVPGVREARVTREWPQGLAVVLVAREPVAAVPEQPGARRRGHAGAGGLRAARHGRRAGGPGRRRTRGTARRRRAGGGQADARRRADACSSSCPRTCSPRWVTSRPARRTR